MSADPNVILTALTPVIQQRHPLPWTVMELWPDRCPLLVDAYEQTILEADGPNSNEFYRQVFDWIADAANATAEKDAEIAAQLSLLESLQPGDMIVTTDGLELNVYEWLGYSPRILGMVIELPAGFMLPVTRFKGALEDMIRGGAKIVRAAQGEEG